MQNDTGFAGDDKVLEIDVTEDGVAMDITGLTIEWRLARRLHETSVLTKTVGSGITITNGVGGIFQVALSDTDTANLIGDYYHQAYVTDGSGNLVTVTEGIITFEHKIAAAS